MIVSCAETSSTWDALQSKRMESVMKLNSVQLERTLARPLSGLLLALILINLALQYGINVWNRLIFDALESRDAGTVFWLSDIFLPLAVASVCSGVANVHCRMTISAALARRAKQ